MTIIEKKAERLNKITGKGKFSFKGSEIIFGQLMDRLQLSGIEPIEVDDILSVAYFAAKSDK